MSTVAQAATELQRLLLFEPRRSDRACGFCRRRSKCSGSVFLQSTVLGWAEHPDATLQELADLAALTGTSLSPQALDQRLRSPAAVTLLSTALSDVVERTLPGFPTTLPILNRFPEVMLLDSTTVVLPDQLRSVWRGNGGSSDTHTQAAVKLGVGFDLVTGALVGPELCAGRTPDRALALQHRPVVSGAMRIADLGFWSLGVFADICATGGHFLSYLHGQTVLLDPETHERIDLLAELERDPTVIIERTVLLGTTHQLPVRLIARRESDETRDRRRHDRTRRARRKGKRPSAETLARAGWSLVVTDLPADQLTADEAFALLRSRWQIELLFKAWKELGHLDTWRSTNPTRIHCEVLAKAIAGVLLQWLVRLGWQRPDHSLTRAVTMVRDFLLTVVIALPHRGRLIATLDRLARVLDDIGGVKRRSDRPATFQILESAPFVGLA